MESVNLVAELSQVEDSLWHASPCGEETVAWLPLMQISETGLWLGLDRQGGWISGRLGGRVTSSVGGFSQSWLTILEEDEYNFWELMSSASARYGLSLSELQRLVPIDDVLSMAIRSESSHWAERAVFWMLNRPLRGDHVHLLRELSTARWANQWTRHSARRLVKNAEN